MTIPYDWEHDGDGDREGHAADTSAIVLYDWEREGHVMLPETVPTPARPRAASEVAARGPLARIVVAAGFVALGFAISAAAVLALVAVILAARGGHN
jgi:hypothetical protein